MRLIVGDECGLLKDCDTVKASKEKSKKKNKGVDRINSNEASGRTHGVVSLAWTAPAGKEFAALLRNGTVQLWEQEKESFTKKSQIENVFSRQEEYDHWKRPLRIAKVGGEHNLLCVANHDGNIVVVDPTRTERTSAIRSSFSSFKDGMAVVSKTRLRQPLISAMATGNTCVACGGKERETVIWDIESSKQIWKAKNLPPDPITQLVPQIWPTSICHWDQAALDGDSNDSSLWIVGTAYHQVRIYDTRQRRPSHMTPSTWMNHRVTVVRPLQNDPHGLVVGDSAGYLYLLDIRKIPQPGGSHVKNSSVSQSCHRLVGPAGSVRDIAVHGSNIAVVGLDRMLRSYSVASRHQTSCIYLKQRLSSVLVLPQEEDASDTEEPLLGQDDVVNEYVNSDSESSTDDDNNGDDDDDDEGTISDSSSSEDDAVDSFRGNPAVQKRQRHV